MMPGGPSNANKLIKYLVMPNMRKSQWSNIRKRLLLLGNKELIAQIKDLYVISDENRRFLEARFAQGGDQNQAALADYKQEIIYCFFGERGISDDLPRLRNARQLIRDYRKATQDIVGTLDLMLHYVETGTEFTNTYGDINEPFYNSLESMLNEFCEGIFKSPDTKQVYGQFNIRLVALKMEAFGIGWGYGDAVQEIIDDLESRFEGR
jgi:hypothetical protein